MIFLYYIMVTPDTLTSVWLCEETPVELTGSSGAPGGGGGGYIISSNHLTGVPQENPPSPLPTQTSTHIKVYTYIYSVLYTSLFL